MGLDTRPIGLFDSGVGGLTVLRRLLELLPQERFVYLGDTARLPYGTKGRATIERYLDQNVAFLARQNVKAVIVACNTASSVLTTKSMHGVPVLGMIEPGARSALRLSSGLRIGLLATRATVAAKAYEKTIATIESRASVFAKAAPLLVPLVEEGWTDDPVTNLILFRYISPLLHEKIDTLILGCTHYPALLESIRRVVGPNIEIADPGLALVEFLAERLGTTVAALTRPTSDSQVIENRFYVTDGAPHFIEIASRLLMPYAMPKPEMVDLV